MNLSSLIQGIEARETRAIARSISETENRTPLAAAILRAVFPRTGRARTLGITGPAGSGKSTLVDRLIAAYRKNQGNVAVLAIDPTSPFTGGAILGDRIRMQAQALDPGTYIRSMATRGHLGGLAPATGDALAILDAAGFETIIVETVGIGQDEVDIARTADVTVVVQVPGMGDDIQTMKAGLMEIGDVFVINKADRDGVPRMEEELQALLSLSERRDGWTPPIVKTVAIENAGTGELVTAIGRYLSHMENTAQRSLRVVERTYARLQDLLEERLIDAALKKSLRPGEFEALVARVAARETDPYSAVESILARLRLNQVEDGVGRV